MEGYGIKARFRDGELGVAGGVGDSCADDSGVLIKIKRSSAGTRSGGGGVSGEQLGGCGSTGRPSRAGRSSSAGRPSCAISSRRPCRPGRTVSPGRARGAGGGDCGRKTDINFCKWLLFLVKYTRIKTKF